jgi:hypothetical protein
MVEILIGATVVLIASVLVYAATWRVAPGQSLS